MVSSPDIDIIYIYFFHMTLFLSKPVCCGAFVLPKLAVANSNPPSPFLPWTTSDVSEEVRG